MISEYRVPNIEFNNLMFKDNPLIFYFIFSKSLNRRYSQILKDLALILNHLETLLR